MKIIDLINQPSIDDSLKIGYLGQSGYVLKKNDYTILIDPYLSNYIEDSNGLKDERMIRNFPPIIKPEEINSVDIVLCTHGHHDHMDPWTLENIKPTFKLYCTNKLHLSVSFFCFSIISKSSESNKFIKIPQSIQAYY